MWSRVVSRRNLSEDGLDCPLLVALLKIKLIQASVLDPGVLGYLLSFPWSSLRTSPAPDHLLLVELRHVCVVCI